MGIRRASPAIYAIAAMVLAFTGCNDTQPDSVPNSTVTLNFKATAKVDHNNCYDVWNDTDGDGTPDTDTGFVYCEPTGSKDTVPVPWHYSLQISVLRAGQTTPEVIASSVIPGDTVNDFISLTGYDPAVGAAPIKPSDGFNYFLNPVEVSSGNPKYLQSLGLDLGPENILGQPPPFEFELGQGDTVIVEARKQGYFEGGAYLQQPGDPSDLELVLSSTLLVGDSPALVQGSTFSSDADKAGFSFSYTRR